MEKEETGGKILICESYPGMQGVFTLALGSEYELLFVSDPAEIPLALRRHPVRLLIWDLDQTSGSMQGVLKAVLADETLTPPAYSKILETLKPIRQNCPDLKILLVAGSFGYAFQAAVIRECGLVAFLTKPWSSSAGVVERIQVLLGDKDSSVRKWTLRMPLDPALSNPTEAGDLYGSSQSR